MQTDEADMCYCMPTLDDKPVRIMVDSCAVINVVRSQLVPPPPKDAPTSVVGFRAPHITMPAVLLQLSLFGMIITTESAINEHATVDIILGRICPQFKKILVEADNMKSIFAISTEVDT